MTRACRLISTILLPWMVVVFVAGCGSGNSVGVNGKLVGGACTVPQDCAQGSTCKNGKDFPGGMCTVACTATSGCPAGSTCIESSGGTCAYTCSVHQDCRASYFCKGKKRVDKLGEVLVCWED